MKTLAVIDYVLGFQWRIQNFPEGGANSQSGCANLFFGRKLHENERIWTPGGGGEARARLRPATGFNLIRFSVLEI